MRNYAFHLSKGSAKLDRLAEITGISINRLAQISNEQIEPSIKDLKEISLAYNLPVSYLLEESKFNNEFEILFRKGNNLQHKQIIFNRFGHIVDNILQITDQGPIDINIKTIFNGGANTFEYAEYLAEKFRTLFNRGDVFGPLNTLPSLLCNLGFVIKIIRLDQDVEGASAFIKGIPFIFLSPTYEPRMLFTLAHELGHILQHHGTDDFFYLDERIPEVIKKRKGNIEYFANTFASCLLLPPQGVGHTLEKLRKVQQNTHRDEIGDIEIIQLSRIFNVSFDVAARRCEDLKLMDSGYAAALSEQVKREYGSSEKRGNLLGLAPREAIQFPETSPFLLDRVDQLIREERLSIGKAAELLGIPMQSILDYRSQIE